MNAFSVNGENDDVNLGFYHFDKHLPKKGSAIYFSLFPQANSLHERIGCRNNRYIIYESFNIDGIARKQPYKVDIERINNKWRYVAPTDFPELHIEPFDEYLVYHNAERNPPIEGQECYFISIKGTPLFFAWEAIANEHLGIYVNGGFYICDDRDYFNDYTSNWESKPWPRDQQALGIIYWRESEEQ